MKITAIPFQSKITSEKKRKHERSDRQNREFNIHANKNCVNSAKEKRKLCALVLVRESVLAKRKIRKIF